MIDAGGEREPQDPRDEAGPHRVVAGLERQHEARDADRERVDHGEVAGQERVARLQSPVKMASTAAQAFLVTNSRATRSMLAITRRPSATTLGQGGEPVVEQDQLRHRLRRRRAGAHGDAEVGVLQGEGVVHAVAGHGHHLAPGPGARAASARLASGVTRPNTAFASAASAELGRVGRELAGVDVVLGVGDVAAQRDGRHGDAGCRPRSPSAARSRLRKYSMVSAASGRMSSLNSTSASALRSGGRVPAGGMEAAPARSSTRRPSDGQLLHTLAARGWSPGSRISGAPTYQAPCTVEGDGGVLVGRVERDATDRRPARRGAGRPAGSPSWWRSGTRRPRPAAASARFEVGAVAGAGEAARPSRG